MIPAFRLNILLAEKALSMVKPKATVKHELAKHLGVSGVRLNQIIRADSKKVISSEKLVRMSQFFECDIDDLFNPALKQDKSLQREA